MLSLLTVFKDLLPAYRIRPAVTSDEPALKLSHDVRVVRSFEAALLHAYHSYLKKLLQAVQSAGGTGGLTHGRIAAKCMAGLLNAAPHFNYRSDLLQALVACLAHEDQPLRKHATDGLTSVLSGVAGEQVAAETVQLIADITRRRGCVAPGTVLDPLLALRFSDILPPAVAEGAPRKKRRGNKDVVERGFLEAQAATDLASRHMNQRDTLDALFELVFRVMKHCGGNGAIQQQHAMPMSPALFVTRFPLLYPSLHLLSKFVHLISLEYVQDVLSELRLLLRSGALPLEARLRVLLTTTELARCKGEAMSTGGGGTLELYAVLEHTMIMPLLYVSTRCSTAELEEGLLFEAVAAPHAMGYEQMHLLITQLLAYLSTDSRSLDVVRQAAYCKRMLAGVLAAGDVGMMNTLLCHVQQMLRRSRRLQGLLDHESGGTSGYNAHASDPVEAGALTAPLWELSLLTQHYHPRIMENALQQLGRKA